MRYMMFIRHKDLESDVQAPQALLDAMGPFVEAEMKSGRVVDTAGLTSTKHATEIRSRDGKLTVTDGPFAESKEVVGGYAIVEAGTREEALDVATRFMELHRVHWPAFDCACEIRPVDQG